MAILRKRQIEMLSQMNGKELSKFIESLPAAKADIERMFEYIEDELYEFECDHTSAAAMRFLMQNNLPFPKIVAWLNENGGYCDCKIMENIEKEWRKAFPEED